MLKDKIEMVQNFINVLEGKDINICATNCTIENGDIVWDNDKALDLKSMDEEELNDLTDELVSYVLDYLREEYLNEEIELVSLDNQLTKLISYSSSIFDYDVRQMIKESFCYEYQEVSGFNFEFEITKNDEDVTKIIVKVTNIDKI